MIQGLPDKRLATDTRYKTNKCTIFTCCGSPTYVELWGGRTRPQPNPQISGDPEHFGAALLPRAVPSSLRCHLVRHGRVCPQLPTCSIQTTQESPGGPPAPAQGQQPSRAASGTCAGTGQSSDAAGSLCVPSCSCPGKGTGSRARQGWLRVPKEYPIPKSEAPLSFPSDT